MLCDRNSAGVGFTLKPRVFEAGRSMEVLIEGMGGLETPSWRRRIATRLFVAAPVPPSYPEVIA